MMARAVQFTNSPVQRIDIGEANIVFEPSVFGGNGTENRLNLVLGVSSNIHEIVRIAEQNCTSSIITNDTMKVKVEMDKVRFWSAENNLISKPTHWRGLTVRALCEIRGFWKSKTGEGISIVCTDMQVTDNKPISPF
jgi:hypothetical protein